MEFLVPTVKIIHLMVSVLLILIILLQPSKSSDIGSMFGGGSSESVFGSSGAMPFLVKMTRLMGVIFVATSLFLGYSSVKSISGSVVDESPAGMSEPLEPPGGESPEPEPAGQVPAGEPPGQMQKAETGAGAAAPSLEAAPPQDPPGLEDPGKRPEESGNGR